MKALTTSTPRTGRRWPVTLLSGTDNPDPAIRTADGPMVVRSLSRATLVLDDEQARLATGPNAPSSLPWGASTTWSRS
jgi:hypothetical protein